jgi:hypothetical protein
LTRDFWAENGKRKRMATAMAIESVALPSGFAALQMSFEACGRRVIEGRQQEQRRQKQMRLLKV